MDREILAPARMLSEEDRAALWLYAWHLSGARIAFQAGDGWPREEFRFTAPQVAERARGLLERLG